MDTKLKHIFLVKLNHILIQWRPDDYALFWHHGINDINVIPKDIYDMQTLAFHYLGIEVTYTCIIEFHGRTLQFLFFNECFKEEVVDPLSLALCDILAHGFVCVIPI